MSLGFILIEVCDANEACTPALKQLETSYSAVSVLEASCMSECELCAECPYVFFNGEIVQASDVASLIEDLETRIKRLSSGYDPTDS